MRAEKSMIILYTFTILTMLLSMLSDEAHYSVEASMFICTTFIVEAINRNNN